MSETAFMAAASADLQKAQGRELFIPELGMTVRFSIATAGATRRILKECGAVDDIKASALMVRDLATDETGAPLVTRDDAGLKFLLDNVRPAVLGRIAKAIGGANAEELGND